MRINPSALSIIREASGHSQASLARASGVSQSRISELEVPDGPKLVVRPPIAKKLADALKVPLTAITAQPEMAGSAGGAG